MKSIRFDNIVECCTLSKFHSWFLVPFWNVGLQSYGSELKITIEAACKCNHILADINPRVDSRLLLFSPLESDRAPFIFLVTTSILAFPRATPIVKVKLKISISHSTNDFSRCSMVKVNAQLCSTISQ